MVSRLAPGRAGFEGARSEVVQKGAVWAGRGARSTLVLVLSLAVALGGCARPSGGNPSELEPPAENTTLGPGDTFTLQIVGEPDLPKDYQVSADGTVTVPFIHSVTVAGLEPHEVAELVRTKLIENKVLMDPSVIVSVSEYRSKRIVLLGQVQEPGSFPVTPGMTLLQAISLGGGLTSVAQASNVSLSRTNGGKVKTVTLDVTAISEGRAPDVALQPGDRIYVPERIF
jgi:polysaccharide biosynthesis/export protein VpsN